MLTRLDQSFTYRKTLAYVGLSYVNTIFNLHRYDGTSIGDVDIPSDWPNMDTQIGENSQSRAKF